MSEELTDVEKSLLLNRATRNAIASFEQFDWGIEASVRAAIDDAADDREYVAGYDGPRGKVCDFLSQYRVEIGNAVLDEVMDGESQEEKRKAAGILKSPFKCDHEGHRYLDDDEKIRCEDCDEVLGIPSEQWDAEMKYDETIEADPCPVCGAEFFNVKVSYGGQFVKRSDEIVEDNQANYLMDDAWDFKIERATCGNCDAPLRE